MTKLESKQLEMRLRNADAVFAVRKRRRELRDKAYEERKKNTPVPEINHEQRMYEYRLDTKEKVLTQYGPKNKLKCCWESCEVVDLDMLTLDHINDDGATHVLPEHRARLSGSSLYLWAVRNKYPKGFQTLCANHQMKKQILKLRADFINKL